MAESTSTWLHCFVTSSWATRSWIRGLGESELFPIFCLLLTSVPSVCLHSRLTNHYLSLFNLWSTLATRAYKCSIAWVDLAELFKVGWVLAFKTLLCNIILSHSFLYSRIGRVWTISNLLLPPTLVPSVRLHTRLTNHYVSLFNLWST